MSDITTEELEHELEDAKARADRGWRQVITEQVRAEGLRRRAEEAEAALTLIREALADPRRGYPAIHEILNASEPLLTENGTKALADFIDLGDAVRAFGRELHEGVWMLSEFTEHERALRASLPAILAAIVPADEVAEVVAELRLFNHKRAADLLERLAHGTR